MLNIVDQVFTCACTIKMVLVPTNGHYVVRMLRRLQVCAKRLAHYVPLKCQAILETWTRRLSSTKNNITPLKQCGPFEHGGISYSSIVWAWAAKLFINMNNVFIKPLGCVAVALVFVKPLEQCGSLSSQSPHCLTHHRQAEPGAGPWLLAVRAAYPSEIR